MRLIDADILVEHLRDQRLKQTGVYTTGFNNATNIAISLVRNPDACPTIEAKPVKRGKWKLHKDGSGTCDQCHFTQLYVWDMDNWDNFCAHCGADMRGET